MPQADPLTVQALESHFDDPFQRGTCENVTHAAELSVEEGQCALRVEAVLNDEDQLVDLWWDGAGCSWCEGQMSVVAESIRASIEESSTVSKEKALGIAREIGITVEGLLELSPQPETPSGCSKLPLQTLTLCLESPLTETEDDLADGSKFGGPSLREEC